MSWRYIAKLFLWVTLFCLFLRIITTTLMFFMGNDITLSEFWATHQEQPMLFLSFLFFPLVFLGAAVVCKLIFDVYRWFISR